MATQNRLAAYPSEASGGRATRVGALLGAGAARLRTAGVPGARRDAEWLLASVLGVSRASLHLAATDDVSSADCQRFTACCARRSRREPLQYIIGSQPFRDSEIQVDGRVLVPRPETERVVDLCLDLHDSGSMADIGTGSGAIAISLAAARPGETVFATDISMPALTAARENALRARAAGITFLHGDLFEALGARAAECALVVCNPPYVATDELATLAPEVRDWEPRLALDGGADGLAVYERLAPAAAHAMRPGAWLVVEIGAGQRGVVEELLAATRAFGRPRIVQDLAGIDRGLGFQRLQNEQVRAGRTGC
jgi:release factor glutamine methyltransferase